jgi:adenylate cyclase
LIVGVARLRAAVLAPNRLVVLGGLLALLVWGCLRLFAGTSLSGVEERSGDLAWRLAAQRVDERRLIVVDIDERSLQELGAWPWPRTLQARLIERLGAYGVRQQVLDVVFPDSTPNDAPLSRALGDWRPVLSQIFALDGGAGPFVGRPAGALDWSSCASPFPDAIGFIANAESLRSPSVGHISPRVESDGVVRKQPAIVCHQGRAYPALALAAMMSGAGEPTLTLERGGQWTGPDWWLRGRNQAFSSIPIDQDGNLRVPWRLHPEAFISLSASDVLAGRIPDDVLRGAWVLVGSSAFGMHDVISTPFQGAASGVQVHAQLIAAMLDDRLPYAPRWAPLVQAVLALAGCVLVAALVMQRKKFPSYLAPLAALLWAAGMVALHGALLTQASLWMGWVDGALFVVSAGLAMGALEHARSRLDRDRLYSHLSSYLPAPVAAALAEQSPSSAIRAATRHVSVLFADIRNFSAYCEARPPEESAAVLHAFFTTATRVIEAHGGVVETLQGDSVVAVWFDRSEGGTVRSSLDVALPDHAGASLSNSGMDADQSPQRALEAALALLHAVHGVLPDPAPAGLEPLALGIGIESGPAMAGSIGLARRRTHMVMGRTVTIASRLVSMTADLAHPILVGEGLAAQVGGQGLQSLGIFLLDGMRVPHHVYAPPIEKVVSGGE